jgi:hypothetical protein
MATLKGLVHLSQSRSDDEGKEGTWQKQKTPWRKQKIQ